MEKTKELRRSGLRGDVGERAYKALRDGIMDGSIAPGQRLVELAVCDWLQISRTPAREALRRLQSNGLLEFSPGGGFTLNVYGSLVPLFLPIGLPSLFNACTFHI